MVGPSFVCLPGLFVDYLVTVFFPLAVCQTDETAAVVVNDRMLEANLFNPDKPRTSRSPRASVPRAGHDLPCNSTLELHCVDEDSTLLRLSFVLIQTRKSFDFRKSC